MIAHLHNVHGYPLLQASPGVDTSKLTLPRKGFRFHRDLLHETTKYTRGPMHPVTLVDARVAHIRKRALAAIDKRFGGDATTAGKARSKSNHNGDDEDEGEEGDEDEDGDEHGYEDGDEDEDEPEDEDEDEDSEDEDANEDKDEGDGGDGQKGTHGNMLAINDQDNGDGGRDVSADTFHADLSMTVNVPAVAHSAVNAPVMQDTSEWEAFVARYAPTVAPGQTPTTVYSVPEPPTPIASTSANSALTLTESTDPAADLPAYLDAFFARNPSFASKYRESLYDQLADEDITIHVLAADTAVQDLTGILRLKLGLARALNIFAVEWLGQAST
ncbi:hypothetical protein EVJ58_g8283 [Rhodofomes roseus]|uniref:Uncharacterized protein n=1 Tax=Rhodofomes roseus TaxID=34475 RepID=A0A4Y9Y015_9APHY|nr:hypothetical protein EVJ58_g8283 [Rhodofomes roseus]